MSSVAYLNPDAYRKESGHFLHCVDCKKSLHQYQVALAGLELGTWCSSRGPTSTFGFLYAQTSASGSFSEFDAFAPNSFVEQSWGASVPRRHSAFLGR
jgi:hypothetical protein